MTLLITYFLLAVLVSFVCSLLESVILSVSPAYISVALKKGKKHGKILSDLKKRIDQPLAAILTLNTVANTVGATGVGAQVLKVYGNGYVAITSAILTLTILIGSEIIPKTLGANNWKRLAPYAAYLIRLLIYGTYPFVWLSKRISIAMSNKDQSVMTREEMIETAELGASEGAIQEKERKIINNLLMLSNIKVSDIMTPRSVVVAYQSNETVSSIMNKHKPIRYSRIPLFDKDLDNVTGLLQRYKLMDAASHDLDDLQLDKLKTPIHSVPENISVSAALDQFIKRKEHLFLVVDDYGTTAGIVTLEDAIETLLGVEIVDELDSVEDLRKYAREMWTNKKRAKQASND